MTASRALRGDGYVSDVAKQKVMAAAEELGYFTDLSARVLRGKRTNVLGLVVYDLRASGVYAIVSEILKVAGDQGKEVLIYNMHSGLGVPRCGGSIGMLCDICDGVLVLQRIPDGLLGVLEKSPVPVVLINYWHANNTLPVVRADNFISAREAVRHLLQQGHQRIAFIGGSPHSGQSAERQRAYTAAMAEHGITPSPAWITSGDFSTQSGMDVARRLLALADRPTAIFAANDDMALGVMAAARDLGIDIPSELSVIGFDDIKEAAHAQPPLSTIRQPVQRIAEAALNELLARIANSPHQHSCLELPSEMVIRQSTAAPPLQQKRAAGKRKT